jgi:CHAD domain-containing protein
VSEKLSPLSYKDVKNLFAARLFGKFQSATAFLAGDRYLQPYYFHLFVAKKFNITFPFRFAKVKFMGKAAEITGLECTADALIWAGEVLRTRVDEITELRGAALVSDDIEAVHDIRVATRRLRGALRDFAPFLRQGTVKTVRKDLKNLADTLGTARDLDVAIVALEKLRIKAEDEDVKEGIRRLIDEKREERERVALDLAEALGVSAIDDLKERFYAALEKATKRKKKKTQSISFNEAGRAVVYENLQQFCGLSASLYRPFEVKKLHRLRIFAKRLRYAVELFTACWGEQMAPFAEEIAEMQSLLGEVHDADVWIASFGDRLLEGDEEIAASHIWLLSQFVGLRNKNYRRALRLWKKWKTERFVERLRELVLSVGEPAADAKSQASKRS